MTFEEFLLTADIDNQIALDAAKVHPVNVDSHRVGSGQGRGFLIEEDIWPVLRTIQDDKTHPLFGLADGVIVTASDASSYFGIDPSTSEGVGNIVASQILVDAGIMTSAQRDTFLGKSITITHPFANKTLADVLAIREPLVWTPCTHLGQDWSVSIPQSDKVRYTVTKTVAGGSVQIQTTWGVSNEVGVVQTTINRITTLHCDDSNISTSDERTRGQVGIPPEARILRMKFKGRDVTSVAVTVGK